MVGTRDKLGSLGLERSALKVGTPGRAGPAPFPAAAVGTGWGRRAWPG